MEEEEAEEAEEGAPAWMATFADLMSLLLTFFVLLLSFANMDVEDFRSALGSVREALGVQFEHPGELQGLTTSIVEMSKQESTPDITVMEETVVQKMREIVKEAGADGEIEIESGGLGVTVRVKDQVLFRPGGDVVMKKGRRAMAVVAKIAKEVPYPIWIEGHTDNRPISTNRFPSNWELSSARAVAVLRYLIRMNVPRERMRVAGYADVKPIASNRTASGRRKNRRVEFVFMRHKKGQAISSARKRASEIKAEASR